MLPSMLQERRLGLIASTHLSWQWKALWGTDRVTAVCSGPPGYFLDLPQRSPARDQWSTDEVINKLLKNYLEQEAVLFSSINRNLLQKRACALSETLTPSAMRKCNPLLSVFSRTKFLKAVMFSGREMSPSPSTPPSPVNHRGQTLLESINKTSPVSDVTVMHLYIP